MNTTWIVYIAECADGTLYTGITTDLKNRLAAHNSPKNGAKYTRARQPVTLRYTKEMSTRSEASKEEYRIKQLSRKDKLALIQKPDQT